MRRSASLSERPKVSIIEKHGWREYRVEAAHRGGVKLAGFELDAFVALVAACLWNKVISSVHMATAVLLLLAYLYRRTNRILWESVVVFPSLGLQFETHRGLSGFSLSSTRIFIPWSSLEDFLIHEGLRGWNVRYYLVAVTRTQQGSLKLEVPFENILPRFPILLEVYRGVQEAMRAEDERCQIDSGISMSTDIEDNK
ncbi:hypothetical protein PYCCODRAFT_1380454 [Trametes coccinea BRFM310]|uniref:Phosphatidylinositol N-acetylglucosaminyltransferase subunit H conserved domain-containing protein n=1 Tax=Trametes coccinea (strain BRFM310) TaxID=1353009 RepID=A0A1Y2J710_TRAC3|nr:hypothetical protein PYCCODRAFT_1380454 [Trametes coccinea BRFM310]